MNIADIDLNLLKIFDAVHAERSVSRAAQRVGLTQPSVSHGLSRLRTLFRDALFVRTRGGVAPTAVADRVAPAIANALRSLQAVLDDAVRFDPTTSDRTFRIHMSDLGEMVFLPPLMRAVREWAPRLRVETRQYVWSEVVDALEHAAVDMAVGHLSFLVGQTAHRKLLREEYVTVRRPGRGTLRHAEYIAVTSHPPTLAILAENGLLDRVRLSTPHFMVLPAILAEVDCAVIVPRTVAASFARYGVDRITPLRGASRFFDVGLFWTRRQDHDPGHRWMRALIVELFGDPGG